MLAGTTVPGGRAVHVPALPVTLHEAHAPQEGLPQQTPSVHMPLRHSVPSAQVVPSGFRFVQIPDWQVYPVTQSPLFAQVVRQAVAPHWRWPGQGIAV